MSDFKTRLLDERTELNDKIDKLTLFQTGPIFSTIDARQQALLNVQVHAMLTYSQVLDERIKLLE